MARTSWVPLLQPSAVAIAIPVTSPRAQPVRQCVVALAARPLRFARRCPAFAAADSMAPIVSYPRGVLGTAHIRSASRKSITEHRYVSTLLSMIDTELRATLFHG